MVDGNTLAGSVMAGQIAGLISDIKTVDEIIKGMFDEAGDVLKNTAKILGR